MYTETHESAQSDTHPAPMHHFRQTGVPCALILLIYSNKSYFSQNGTPTPSI